MTSYSIRNWLTLLLLCTSAPLVLCCDQFDRGSRQAMRELVLLVTEDYDVSLCQRTVVNLDPSEQNVWAGELNLHLFQPHNNLFNSLESYGEFWYNNFVMVVNLDPSWQWKRCQSWWRLEEGWFTVNTDGCIRHHVNVFSHGYVPVCCMQVLMWHKKVFPSHFCTVRGLCFVLFLLCIMIKWVTGFYFPFVLSQ